MKNDINLLQKRKGEQYSAQKWAKLLLGVVLFAVAVYAGFMLPNMALSDAKLTAAELDGKLNSSAGTQQNLTELTEAFMTRSEQLEVLTALDTARSDMSGYLEAVETSLPTSAHLTEIDIVDRTITISGIASDDSTIAAFCVRLRDTGKFSNVFLQTSTANTDGSAGFWVIAELPVSLDSSSILPQETDEAQITEEVTP